MFCAKPVVGKMSRDARNLLHLLPRKIHSKTAYISNMCTHAAFVVFLSHLDLPSQLRKKVYRFPVLYGRSGGPFKEKLGSGRRTPRWSVNEVTTI